MRKYKIILFCIVILHFVILIFTLTGRLNFLSNDTSLRKGIAADFFAVYQAGNNILNNDSPYHDTEGKSTPYSFPYRYLPIISYTFGVIFNIFKPFTGYLVYITFCEMLLFFNIYIVYKISKNYRNFVFSLVPWLLFSPYFIELYMGQWNFLLASIIFYTILGVLYKSKIIYIYVLAPLIKPNSLVILPALLKDKKVKLIILSLVFVTLTSFSYFYFNQEDIKEFLKNFKDSWYSHGGNLGFKSLYYIIAIKIFHVPFPRIWFYLIIGILGIITLLLTVKSKYAIFRYSLWICFYFFIYKDVWEHHFVLFMPIFSLIASKMNLKKLLNGKNILFFLSFLFIALPSIFSFQYLFYDMAPTEPDDLNIIFVIIYHLIKILGVFLLFIWICKMIFQKREMEFL